MVPLNVDPQTSTASELEATTERDSSRTAAKKPSAAPHGVLRDRVPEPWRGTRVREMLRDQTSAT